MKRLIRDIQDWSVSNGIDQIDPKAQVCKITEELGELARGVNRKDFKLTQDSVGDITIALISLCEQVGLDYMTSVDIAFKEVKDRKGEIVNGQFIKETDLG